MLIAGSRCGRPVSRYARGVPGTTTLYRPVGPLELKLIADAGFRRFPPRLPDQPIFYRSVAREPRPSGRG